jgi:hypothetical protein
MTPAEYRTALATLGLSQLAAGRWLGVSNKTAQRYATTGPSGAAARAIGMAVAMMDVKRHQLMLLGGAYMEIHRHPEGQWVRHSDLMDAVGLGPNRP